MYDPWNVTRFRQSHQMSMAPAEQNLPPYLLSNVPIDATVPQPYMVHQGPSSIPAFGYQSDSTVYTHLPYIPVSLTETLNSSYYTQYFVSGQQYPQWTQSLYLIPSHRPPLTSPNGAEMLHLPPPLPLVGQAPSADLVCPPYPVGLRGAQNTLHPQCPQSSSHIPFVRFLPLPPPPPPPYPLERPPLPPPSPLEPPPLPPPSPSPSSPHVPAASHLLPSSHINQNLPYSSHEGMKHGDLLSRSIQLHILREEIHHNGSSSRPSQLDSLTNTGVSHLDTDSDVDMEDDITLVDNEHLVSEQLNEPQTVTAWDSQCQSFLRSESLVFEEQLKESNEVLISTAPSEVLNETYATAAEVGKYIASEPVTGVDPIPVSKYVNVSASDVRTRSSPDLVGNVGSKSLLEYGKGFRVSEDVMAYSNAFELANVYSEANQSKDSNNGTDKSYLYDAFKGRGVGATPKSDMFGTKDKDCMPTRMKIDVFERSVKENASDSNYVDIGYSSRHGKGSQTRIQSGSPISKFSQKRKGRRNRSYDPLFDCLEGSSNSSTPTNAKKRKIDDSDMITPGVSYMPLGLVESNKEDNGGSAALCTSLDTNKYDQTTAEWIENENHDDPVTDVEKDQVKTSRKRMKDKSFRLMNRFKVALRGFVKGVLKPYWREGNMSKVVFKMIVKKTVDKVLGAMENHKIPESEEKINRYIDSSHRKLTNLVMGYVDKFVRV